MVEQQMGSGCLRGRHEYPSRPLTRSVTLITIGREEQQRTRMMRPRPSFAQNTSTLLPHLSKLCAVRTTAACMTVGCSRQLRAHRYRAPPPCSSRVARVGTRSRVKVESRRTRTSHTPKASLVSAAKKLPLRLWRIRMIRPLSSGNGTSSTFAAEVGQYMARR